MQYQPEIRARQQELLRYLALQRKDIVIDLGCGTGYFTSLIKDSVEYAVGADIDSAALAIAKEYCPDQDFLLSDASRLPFRDNAATKILCTEVLEHVLDDQRLVGECFRILRDEGAIVCSSPNAGFPFRSRKSSHTEAGPELHVRAGYSPASLRQLLTRAGFSSMQLCYALPMMGTLLIDVLERTYSAAYTPLRSQAEFMRLERSPVFGFFKALFPLMLRVTSITFPKTLGGSILVARAVKSI
jgi:ubiquinone/menaquinone biosynthesis C-methylase UbiE